MYKFFNKIGYILIITSFIILIFGITLEFFYSSNIKNKKDVLDSNEVRITKRPIQFFDDEPKENNDGNINSNTVNESNNNSNVQVEKNNNSSKKSERKIEKKSDKKSEKKSDKNAEKKANNNNNNTEIKNDVERSVPEVSPEVSPPVVNTYDYNDHLRNNIQNKYGITVKYGNEVSGYGVGGMSVIPIHDYGVNTQVLNNLDYILSKYPAGIFRELGSRFPLTIYLIDKYSTLYVTGATDTTKRGAVTISIATAYPMEDTVFHETFHYMEYYINTKGGYFTIWNSLNPQGFVWNNVNGSLSFDRTFSQDSFFVNDYAQTSPEEDRASTFEYMNASVKASCLNNGTRIHAKAKYISQLLDDYLNTVTPYNIEYWERFL